MSIGIMIKKALSIALLVSGWTAFAGAKNAVRVEHGLYRIDMRGQTTVLAKDAPVTRGSVVLFHRHPDGLYTSVPREEVTAIFAVAAGTFEARRTVVGAAARLPAAGARPLAPGDVLLLGSTDEGGATPTGSDTTTLAAPSPSGDIPARLALESQIFPGDLPAQTGPASGSGYLPTYGMGTPAINPTLNGTRVTAPATAGPNGFPITAASPQGGTRPINPNGFPATTATGAQSGTQTIDPNGFPAMSAGPSTASPQAASPATAVRSPAGTRGSTQSASPAVTTSSTPATGAVSTQGKTATTTTAPNGQPPTNSGPSQNKTGQTAAPANAPAAGSSPSGAAPSSASGSGPGH